MPQRGRTGADGRADPSGPVQRCPRRATVAYSAVGASRWVSRFNSRSHCSDFAAAVAVSPTGRRVFVAGTAQGATCRSGTATIAYNAVTGAPAWTNRGLHGRNAAALAVAPGGTTVFLAGGAHTDFLTVAYRN